ncbi:hypothetical protein SUGI_0016090 [Cryptomeria japonica]|uniref:vacuolar-processing enzyme n=1 Tax=Cryptomeria japonica TaxID=3369 RepID=UPI002408BA3D|nr:vacuolar-processing enzyme [Cryptomeria japonica]GLJ05324.1 hypothetical protein SUGI_0016090 [Cryptomeria japonica]
MGSFKGFGPCLLFCVLLLVLNIGIAEGGRIDWNSIIKLPTEADKGEEDDGIGTRWAVLVAGSSGYWNYRHQADVCHAYQVLKRGGLKEENIVVFMYDDIATNKENPRPGTIINHPQGSDIYAGVPKDYTGGNVTVQNFFAVLLGDKSLVKGGSGKVVESGPNDHIFIYYSDHGGAGVLGMPIPPYLYAHDFVQVLKKKHDAGTYKNMVIYIEACESGSIFEGLLPKNLNIYATTAASADENSWGTYCPGMEPSPPSEYDTCLGDLYSVAWMEDSETNNLKKETLKHQYNLVKLRTSKHNTYVAGSHVMQYGDISISNEQLYLYMGFDPANGNATLAPENSLPLFEDMEAGAINQRDADILYFWQKYKKSKEDSYEKLNAQKKIVEFMSRRMHLDNSVKLVGNLLFGLEKGPAVLNFVRMPGEPLVDDWDCLKTMVRTFESHCGSLSQYGMKHMRALANICNEKISVDAMARVSSEACTQVPSEYLSLLQRGFSA